MEQKLNSLICNSYFAVLQLWSAICSTTFFSVE